ncbi:HAD hydrolase-like protein [Candidatus Dojkabacteria bacterium]|nr:HAD hydrolase-like protein [Candidatus Dojkabacteria bacterium]
MLNKYKFILFDFDDTLVNTREHIWAHHKYVAKEFYEIELTDEKLKEHYGEPMEELVLNLYERKDTAENMLTNYTKSRDQFPKTVYPDTIPTLNNLFALDKQLGIITATMKEYLVSDLKKYQFPYEKFLLLQGADETEFHKPDGRVFDFAFEEANKLGISKAEIIYIGDGLKDLMASQDAGIDFIGVAKGMTTKETFEKEGVIAITDLSELL